MFLKGFTYSLSIIFISFLSSFIFPSAWSAARFSAPSQLETEFKTCSHDLRRAQTLPSYNQGSFPILWDAASTIKTHFFENIPEAPIPQRFSMAISTPQTIKTEVSTRGLCRVLREAESPAETILTLGEDDRRKLVKDTTVLPFRMQGQMCMEFGNQQYVGSGIMVGPHHVLTAGHNLYSHELNHGWATKITFSPGRNGPLALYGEANGAILLALDRWVSDENKNYDMGMVILDRPLGYETGWAGLFSMAEADFKNHTISVVGYPGEKKSHMWMMEGVAEGLTQESLSYNIDTTPGQSGSGVIIKQHSGYYVVGIHAYGPYEGRKINSATRLSYQKAKYIIEWMKTYQLSNFLHPYHDAFLASRKVRLLEEPCTNPAMFADSLLNLGELVLSQYSSLSDAINLNRAILILEEAASFSNINAMFQLSMLYIIISTEPNL